MASSQTLREFLVKIGWKVDETGWRQIESRLASTLKGFEQMGKVVAIAGGAITAAVTKAASDMEKLYYSAQRAGTSVSALQSLRFAAEQTGIGAENITAAIQGMATAFRTSPGLASLFQSLGLVRTGDNAKNLINFVDKLKTMPFFLAAQFAQMFGMDEKTLFALEANNDALKEQIALRERLTRMAGMDPEKMAAASVEFSRHVGLLLESVKTLAQLFGAHLLPFADQTVQFLQRAVEEMIKLDSVTHGWSTGIIGVATALGGVATAFGALRGAAAMIGIGGAAAEGGGLMAGIGAFLSTALPVVLPIIITAVVAYLGRGYLEKGYEWLKGKAASASDFIAGNEGLRLQPYRDASGHLTIGYGHLIKPGEDFSGGITRAGALRLLAGDTASAAAAIARSVRVPLNSNQLAALTDFVYNVGPGAFARSTLLKDLNLGDFAGAAGEFTRWSNAGGMYNSGLYNRRAADRDLFLKPVTVNQTNNTTVTSSGPDSAQEIGRVVAQEQTRANGDLVRNLIPVTQ